MSSWNPWHGCTRISPGCLNCYVYRRDAEYGRNSARVAKTASFALPLARTRGGGWRLQPSDGVVYTCLTSDFFHPQADAWRPEAWDMMRRRSDLFFHLITKRPERFFEGLPSDWGNGYPNVHLSCTCEDQERADERLAVFLDLPLAHRSINHEPMLGPITIAPWLKLYPGLVENVSCGGESGPGARLCDYAWILYTRGQCLEHKVSFTFRQTGALFKKGFKIYRIPRPLQQEQARKAGIDYDGECGRQLG